MSETARTIRGDRVPVVDTWRQTETGSIMIAPLPGLTVLKPGSRTKRLPGIGAALVADLQVRATEEEAKEQ